jgi:hypothetical protein
VYLCVCVWLYYYSFLENKTKNNNVTKSLFCQKKKTQIISSLFFNNLQNAKNVSVDFFIILLHIICDDELIGFFFWFLFECLIKHRII